jgi:hypothetical protein
MPKRYVRKLAMLAKIETTYGVDAAPTGAANAILMTQASIEPMAGSEESRNLLLPWLGHQGVVLTGQHVVIEGMVEVAGAGAAGSAPGYGPLLRACGMAQTIVAGVSVDYDPVSAGYEALTCYYNLDGVRHIVLGARATVSVDLSAQKIPHFRFRIVGLLGTISDAVLPVPIVTAFQTPRVVSNANTDFSIHGFSGIAEQLSIDLGNQVEPRLLVGAESVEIVDRQSTGSVTLEANLMAAKNWFEIADLRTRGALSIVHGTEVGNIVEFTAPTVEVGRPSHGDSQGILSYNLSLMLCANLGNDELKISVR